VRDICQGPVSCKYTYNVSFGNLVGTISSLGTSFSRERPTSRICYMDVVYLEECKVFYSDIVSFLLLGRCMH
jgi:hypothetical protein